MNRTPEQWAQVKPDAFLEGSSIVQARNVIEMMQQDIAKLAASRAKLIKLAHENDALAYALENLHAMVWGASPSLLEDDHHDGMCLKALEPSRKRNAALESKEG